MNFAGILNHIVSHPLNNGRELEAISRFARWQLKSRISPKTRQFQFVENLQLNASPGETGVTGNIYGGLHEYEGMAFTLHFLRDADLFLDVGANAGSYSVLASATGAKVIAFEPGESLDRLRANIKLNDLDVDVRAVAVGDRCGTTYFTTGKDTCNSIAPDGEGVAVAMINLDSLGISPSLMKIDVETFEASVLRGAVDTLKTTEAIIIESADECHGMLGDAGFRPVEYDPAQRVLRGLDGPRSGIVNTIYVRDIDAAGRRVAEAREFLIAGRIKL